MKREILLVNFDFPPVQGPGVWRMLGFASHLPSLGWRVSVVCSDRNVWHQRTEPGLLGRLPPGIEIHRIKGRPAGDIAQRFLPAGVVRAWRELLPDRLFVPALKLAMKALSQARGRPFVVLTSGPPHLSHLAGLLLKSTRSCIWVADFRDLWMDDAAQAWSGAYQRRLGRMVERAVFRRADAVVTVSPTWVAHLKKKGTAPVVLIRNATDTEDATLPVPERPWPANEPVLLFAGTPQPNNAMHELWLGIRRYLDSRQAPGPSIRFVFLGLDRESARQIAHLELAEWIEDLGPQPHDRTVALLRGADAALIPIRAAGTPASKGTIPAKVYQAIALKKPIVLFAEADGDAAALLAGYPHYFAAGDDSGAIAATLHHFASGFAAPDEATAPAKLAGWNRRAAAIALDRLLGQLHPAFARPVSGGSAGPVPEG